MRGILQFPQEGDDNAWEGAPSGSLGGPSGAASSSAGAPTSSGGGSPGLQLRLVEGLSAAGIQAIAAGGKHFACLSQTGDLHVWGCGSQGQLGLGDFADAPRPKLLRPVLGKTVVAVRNFSTFSSGFRV